MRGRLGIVAIGLVVALSGCASQPDQTSTPEPSRSVSPIDRAAADDAVDAFLAAMADPDVTYRVTGHLQVQPLDDNGQAAIDIRTRYDVKGDDYAGSAYLAGYDRDPTVGGSIYLVVLDGRAHVMAMTQDRFAASAAPTSLRRPDALRRLTAQDLEFVGVGDDGLFEYDVASWLGADPIGEWSDLGVVPARDFPPTELYSHRTRLILDEAGVPHQLVTTWTFAAVGTTGEASGTIVEEVEGLGMYVSITESRSPHMVSSHDVVVGVDADRRIITEPWYEVLPQGGDTSTVEVTFEQPDRPLMLGIEGAVGFIRSQDEHGALIVDRIVALTEDTIAVPSGPQTLVAYYRTCSGNCGLLDPHSDFCSVDADLTPGGRYHLLVDVRGPQQATCTLTGER